MSIDERYQALRRAYEAIEIGQRVRLLRVMHEMSQSELGRHLGIKANTVSQFESGVSRPAPDIEIRLKAAFGVTTDWLRFGEMSGLSPELIRRLDDARVSLVPAKKRPTEDRLPPKKPRSITRPARKTLKKQSKPA